VAAKKRKVGMVEKDMISELPDAILHGILSHLPTKEAVRTSTLSKRWGSLWTELPSFRFEMFNDSGKTTRKKQKLAHTLLHSLESLLPDNKNKIEKVDISMQKFTVKPSKVTSLLSLCSVTMSIHSTRVPQDRRSMC